MKQLHNEGVFWNDHQSSRNSALNEAQPAQNFNLISITYRDPYATEAKSQKLHSKLSR